MTNELASPTVPLQCTHHFSVSARPCRKATVLPAVFVWQSAQSNGSLSTRTFKEAFHCLVPPQIMVLLYTTIRRLEVGVTTLEPAEE